MFKVFGITFRSERDREAERSARLKEIQEEMAAQYRAMISRSPFPENHFVEQADSERASIDQLKSAIELFSDKVQEFGSLELKTPVETADGWASFEKRFEALEAESKVHGEAHSLHIARWRSNRETWELAVQFDEVLDDLYGRFNRASAFMAGAAFARSKALLATGTNERDKAAERAKRRWAKLEPVKDLAVTRRKAMPEKSRAQAIREMRDEIIAAAKAADCPLTGAPSRVEKTIEGWLRGRGVS